MRIRHRRSPLLLLLIPSLAAAAAVAGSPPADLAPDLGGSSIASGKSRIEVGTKDAPVDGKDGRPHEGPFVEVENLRKAPSGEDALLREDDDAERETVKTDVIIDGKRIPDSNDGVMDDKNRPEPKEGTTGTGGGVSEKDKARKAQEGRTGERVENKPETPKEAPPLPHSEQEKMVGDKDTKKTKQDAGDSSGFSGLEKPADLPDRTHDQAPPLPDSANKDHLDVSNGGSTGSGSRPSSPGTTYTSPDDEVGGVIRPFHSFCLSLTMILFSEVGDKTFLIAALMAMKHDRLVVFTAAFSALITMTVLSAVLGHAVPALIPKRLTNYAAAALFLVFGARLLREGIAMSPDEGVAAEMQEVEMELAEKEDEARRAGRRRASVSPYALEMGLGRASRKDRPASRFPTPPRSPSTSPDGRSPSRSSSSSSPSAVAFVRGALAGLHNLLSLLLSPAWVQTFVMTFLGEWGDRSQIATIAMAAGQDYWWVTLGAVLGHGCCTGVAVIGGRAIAGRVSLKAVTVGGAIAFLLFGIIYFVEGLYA